jgi:hypothetical protein
MPTTGNQQSLAGGDGGTDTWAPKPLEFGSDILSAKVVSYKIINNEIKKKLILYKIIQLKINFFPERC